MAEDFLTNFQYSRQQQRYTTLSGVTPTMPVLTGATMTGYTEADNMVLGNFIDTDILDSEIFLNTSDDRVFIRSNDTILEFLMSGSTGSTYNDGNGITIGTGNTVNLGGAITQPVTILSGSSTELLDIGGNTSNNLAQVRINSTSFQSNHLTAYDGTGIGTYINTNPGGFSSVNTINSTSRTEIANSSSNAGLYNTSNKIVRLFFNGPSGIPNGSGESFTLNGTTFTEGIDFTGQGDAALDAATIAALNYSGVTYFDSVTDEGSGFVRFNFTNPVQVSETFTDVNFLVFNWESSVQTDDTGVTIKVGDDDFYGTPGTILAIGDSETIFTDNSAIPKGIQYGANYDATLVDDSLITKRYVDNAISAITDNNYYTTGATLINDIIYFDRNDTLSAYTADLTSLVSGLTVTGGNGITIGTGNTINLGGLLTQSTTISGNSQTFDLGVTGSELSFLRIKSIQSQEDYKFSGEGLEVTQNPGTFITEFDYTSSLGNKSKIQQNPNTISTTTSSNSGNTTSAIIQAPGIINIITNTDESTLSDSGLVLDQPSDSFRFADNRITARGLEYQDDYSANFSIRSLVDKAYVDSAITGTTLTGGNGITIGTGNTINLGGLLTQSTTISGNSQTFDLGVAGSQLSFFRINTIQGFEEYSVPGYILTTQQNPGGITSVVSNDTGMGAQSDLHPGNFVFQAIGDSGNTYTNLYASNTQGGIISIDLINNSSSYFNINNNGSLNLGVQGSGSTNSSGLDLDDTAGGNGLRFIDGRANGAGLEYGADYSTNFTNRSLVDKEFVDNAISTVSFSGGSGNCISDLYVTNIHGCSPITIKDELIIESGITGTGNIDITGNVISDVVQLRGGVGTQGEMSWSADEETVQLIMDGTTLHIGQDTFVHARNNTASIITKGTAVYASGTLGASGRITVAPMIADGTIAGRLFIGLAAENIAIGADGQVMTFGKIRQINTNAYNDGDVLWLSPSVAGQLTTTEPTAPNLKIATAFVIHAATNGTVMVRAEQGTDLHTDQRVQVSGLTDGDVLTWSNANQRWENEAPTGGGGGHEIYNGTDVTPLPQRAGLRFTGYLEAVDDAGNDESVVNLSSTAITPTEISRFDENGSGNIDLKIAENKLLTGNVNGFATELTFAQEGILGLDVNNEVKEFEVVEIYNILKEEAVTGNKQLALIDINGTSANIKAKFEISAIAIQNTTANAVTINIGSAALGTDVANTVLIGANATLKLPLGTTFFSTTLGQNLFISSGSWNSASINIHVTISKIWQ